MQVSAKLKNLRVSARKVRLVADLIRGKDVSAAQIQLRFSTKKTAADLLGLLNSAVANAENNFNLKGEDLFVETICVNDGPVMKRWRPRAMGRAGAILKRSCTVNLVLNEKGEAAKKVKRPAQSKVAKKTAAVVEKQAEKSEPKAEIKPKAKRKVANKSVTSKQDKK